MVSCRVECSEAMRIINLNIWFRIPLSYDSHDWLKGASKCQLGHTVLTMRFNLNFRLGRHILIIKQKLRLISRYIFKRYLVLFDLHG